MGNPEFDSDTLARLHADFPSWRVCAVPALAPEDTGGAVARRPVHPALRHLARWEDVHATTPGALRAQMEHLEALAYIASGVFLARDGATPRMLELIREHLEST